MSAPGEIITLQFGPAANAAGTHFWNVQDELLGLEAGATGGGTAATAAAFESGVLWAEGRGATAASGPAYTPRLLIFDERESLGGGGGLLGAGGGGPAPPTSGGAWAGRVTRAGAPPAACLSPWAAALASSSSPLASAHGADDLASAAAALSLDGGVAAWPDYVKAPIPRAAVVSAPAARPPRSAAPGWGPPGGEGEAGVAAAAAEGVRRLAEACDRLAGLAVLVDDTGGWGAAAAAALADVEEGGSVGRRPRRLVAAVRPAGWWEGGGGDPAALAARTAAAAASAAFLAPAAHVYVPFDLPAGTGGGGGGGGGAASAAGLFRSGAAVAAAWDGLTTPVRLRRAGPAAGAGSGALDVDALASLVAGPGGRGRWGDVVVGLPAAPAAPPPPAFTSAGTASWTARIPRPDGSRARALLAESVVWRGPAGGGGALSLTDAAAALDAALGAEAAADAATAAGGVAVRHRCVALQPLPLPLPWPAGFPPGLAPGAAGAPLLTRLRAVRGARAAVAAAARDFAAAAATAAGRVALGPAGADADALAEGLERLREGREGGGSSSSEEAAEEGWSD